MSPQNPCRRTPAYILSLRRFKGEGPTREHGEPARKKTETHNKAEVGKKWVTWRRVEERVKSNEATKGTLPWICQFSVNSGKDDLPHIERGLRGPLHILIGCLVP